MPGRIILITGVMAAGKSTVAQRVAEALPKSVHLRGDMFRKMIVNGRADMSADESEEALQQLSLRYRTSVEVAKRYAEAGFDVVYQDVILGEMLTFVLSLFDRNQPHVFALNPRSDIVEHREQLREKVGYIGFTVQDLMQILENRTPRLGIWIDSSDQSPDDTAAEILSVLSGED